MSVWTFQRNFGDAKSLSKRRREALNLVLGVSSAVGLVSGAPSPGAEIPKQGLITIGDAVLLKNIYEVYFDEAPDEERIREMLSDAGLKIMAGGVIVYVGVKLSEGVVAEVLNFVPGLGWMVSGLITASVTASVASAWWLFCDRKYQGQEGPLVVGASPPIDDPANADGESPTCVRPPCARSTVRTHAGGQREGR